MHRKMHLSIFCVLLLSGEILGELRSIRQFKEVESIHENQIYPRGTENATMASNDNRISENARKHINMEREKEGLPPLPEAADPGKGHQQGRGFIDSLLSSPVMLVGGLVNGLVDVTSSVLGETLTSVGGTLASTLGVVSGITGGVLNSVTGLVENLGETLGQVGGGLAATVGNLGLQLGDTVVGVVAPAVESVVGEVDNQDDSSPPPSS